MENASKALLIAGGVLLTMIVASFGVYLYGVYKSHSESMLARMSEKEISEFNAQFTKYEGRDLTINEVVTLMNLVRDNNQTKTGSDYKIEINFNDNGVKFTNLSDRFSYNAEQCDNPSEYQRKCNDLVKKFSQIGDISVVEEDGTIKTEKGYIYYFRCEINGYHETTGLVSEITIKCNKKE